MNGQILLEVDRVNKSFNTNRRILRDISFTLCAGDFVGLMGASGEGKTTLGKIIVGLMQCDSGEVRYRGNDILKLNKKEMKSIRPKLQMVFQDYRQSLPPNLRVGDILSEALVFNHLADGKEEAKSITSRFIKQADLPESVFFKYPRQLSGGEAQRVALIRALELKPELLILDEVTSGLDQSTSKKIMGLVRSLSREGEMATLIISHDPDLIQSETNKFYYLNDASLIR